MNNTTNITHDILVNSGYRKIYFPYTKYVKEVEDNRHICHIAIYPSDDNNFSISINKYLSGFVGLMDSCNINCIKDCQRANKIIELFTNGLGLLVIPDE